ncbi:unnamed protein product, partial [marine sediment metagenome]
MQLIVILRIFSNLLLLEYTLLNLQIYFPLINLQYNQLLLYALYSVGLPPEILGLNALNKDDLQFIREVYVNFEEDLRDSLRYFNPSADFIPKGLEVGAWNF